MVFDERSSRFVNEDWRSCVGSLRAAHWNSLIPKRDTIPELYSFPGALDSFLSYVMLLDEKDLKRGGERGYPRLDLLWFGQIAPQSPGIEGDQR
ncbi:unnamed protein product [Sphagnum tenellum]